MHVNLVPIPNSHHLAKASSNEDSKQTRNSTNQDFVAEQIAMSPKEKFKNTASKSCQISDYTNSIESECPKTYLALNTKRHDLKNTIPLPKSHAAQSFKVQRRRSWPVQQLIPHQHELVASSPAIPQHEMVASSSQAPFQTISQTFVSPHRMNVEPSILAD